MTPIRGISWQGDSGKIVTDHSCTKLRTDSASPRSLGTIAAVCSRNELTDQLITYLGTRSVSWDDYVMGVINGQGDTTEAISVGWADAAMNMADSNQLMFEALQESFYQIQDTLTGFFETGQIDANTFFDSLISMWLNTAATIAANQLMLNFGFDPMFSRDNTQSAATAPPDTRQTGTIRKNHNFYTGPLMVLAA